MSNQVSDVARYLSWGAVGHFSIFDLKMLLILKFCIKNGKTPFNLVHSSFGYATESSNTKHASNSILLIHHGS